MKHVGIAFMLLMSFAFTLLIVTSCDAKSTRKVELERALNTSMKSCMNNLMQTDTYEPTDGSETKKDLFVADFMQTFLVQIVSDSKVTVNIKEVDTEKGLLSVETVEEFMYPVGIKGRVVCDKTVIYDREDVPNDITYAICYHITKSDGTDQIYKKYLLGNGNDYIIPTDPTADDGKQFIGWSKTPKGEPETLEGKVVTQDADYYAVFR